MQTSAPADLTTLDGLIAWLVEHRRQHPEHGAYHVEVRDRLVVQPPAHVTHDDRDRVIILLGVPCR